MSDAAVIRVLTGPRLVIHNPEGETLYPLIRPSVVLGRIDSSDVVLAHPSVSRVHARVMVVHGCHHLMDLGSRSGTLINGQPVPEPGCELQNGDVITVGAFTIRFEC